jgi:hypothetical protein
MYEVQKIEPGKDPSLYHVRLYKKFEDQQSNSTHFPFFGSQFSGKMRHEAGYHSQLAIKSV